MKFKIKIQDLLEPTKNERMVIELCKRIFDNVETAYWRIQEIYEGCEMITPLEVVIYCLEQYGWSKIIIYHGVTDEMDCEKTEITIFSYVEINLDKENGKYNFPAIPKLPQYCKDAIRKKTFIQN